MAQKLLIPSFIICLLIVESLTFAINQRKKRSDDDHDNDNDYHEDDDKDHEELASSEMSDHESEESEATEPTSRKVKESGKGNKRKESSASIAIQVIRKKSLEISEKNCCLSNTVRITTRPTNRTTSDSWEEGFRCSTATTGSTTVSGGRWR